MTGAALHQRTTARKRGGTALLAMLPFVIFTVALTAYPFARVVQMAFSDTRITGGQFTFEWVGVRNFQRILVAPETWQALGNTGVFVVATVLGSLMVGIAAAVLVNRAVWMLPIARNVLIWPAVIAPVVISLMWLMIMDPTVGGLNKLVQTLGLPAQSWLDSGAGAMTTVILVDIWHWSPVVFLFMYTALQAISAEVLEAARMDGASEWSILRRIVLPLLLPAIGAVAIVRTVMGIKVFDEMYLLTAGGPNGATTLVSQRIQLWFFHDLRFGEAASFSILVIVFTAAVLVLFFGVRAGLKGQAR